MKFTLSKKQWEFLGKQAGWTKSAQSFDVDNQDTGLTPFEHNKIVAWAIRKTDSNERADALVKEITSGLSRLHSEDKTDAISVLKIDGVDALLHKLSDLRAWESGISPQIDSGKTFHYFINLDERGSFYADVRLDNGHSVFEIKAGNELEEGESSIFDDGYMKNKTDLQGLKEYLVDLKIMSSKDKLVFGD